MVETQRYLRLKAENICNEGCLNVLQAFLRDLGRDYRCARNDIENSKSKDNIEHYQNLRSIFLSDYFAEITNLIGSDVLDSLDRDWERDHKLMRGA